MKKSRLIKRIGSLFVIMAMLVTMFATVGITSVSAAPQANGTDVDFGWWVHPNGTSNGNWTLTIDTYDNSKAIYVKNSTASTSGTMEILNPYSFVHMPMGKKWQVTFDMKGYNTTDAASSVAFSTTHASTFSSLDATKTEVTGRDGWYTYTAKTSSVVNAENQPGLIFKISAKAACELYIDNVHLYALDDDDNAVTTVDYAEDGSFETYTKYGYSNAAKTIMKGHPFEVAGWSALGLYGAKYDPQTMDVQNVLDEANAHSGNGALKIVRTAEKNTLPTPAIRLQTQDSIAAGTYTLSFYLKGDMPEKNTSAANNSGLHWTLQSNNKTLSKPADWTITDDNGWKKCSVSLTTTAAANLQFNIADKFVGYLDDVSLKDSSGKEMLSNTSFDIEVPDATEYEPANPFIISTFKDGGVNNISWRNPNNDKLTKVSMYKLVSGEWSLVSDQYEVTPGKVFEVYDENLTSGTIYTYKLRFDFSDGERREVVLSKNPKEMGNTNRWAGDYTDSTGWRVVDRSNEDANKYFLPNNVTIDTTEKASGTASLHIFTNKSSDTTIYRPGSNLNWSTGYWVRLQMPLTTTEAGKYYKLSYKIKVNNATATTSSKRVLIGGGARDESSAPYSTGSTDGWVEKSLELYKSGSGSAVGPFQWWLGADDVQDLWIDDITLYELTGSGGTVVDNAVNHIGNGDFETYTAAADITGQTAVAGNKSAKISWTAPTDSRYVRVYEVTEGGDLLRAVCEPSAAEVTIENLKNSQEYTFKLQSQNNNGVLSDAVTVYATPVAPPYDIESDFALKLDGTAAEAVTGNGTYSVSLDVTNYTVSNFAPALIVALYKDDILVSFDKSDSQLAADEVKKTLTANVTISDYDANAKYEISAFFWNGFDTMNPLLRSLSWDNK